MNVTPKINHTTGVIRFGPFSVELQSGELKNGATRLRLQKKSFELLLILLEKPGQIVQREEICSLLWPGKEFVGLEGGLNTATRRLRAALNDSADSPRYIETIPRAGYRWIGAVPETAEADSIPGDPERISAKGAASRPASRLIWPVIGLMAAGLGAALLLSSRDKQPEFQQVTFQRGSIDSARFNADGKSVSYSACWNNSPSQVYRSQTGVAEPQPLGFAGSTLAAVSPHGQLAMLSGGKLLISSAGGVIKQVAEYVTAADWSRKSGELAALRGLGSETLVEYPLGVTIHRSARPISHLRVSPDGNHVAFVEHPLLGNLRGRVLVVDRRGDSTAWTEPINRISGLAWTPSGDEVWLSGDSVWAAHPTKRLRKVGDLPGSPRLEDISDTSQVLVIRDTERVEMTGKLAGDAGERDLSWMDRSGAQDISRDGSMVLFNETGRSAGPQFTMYLLRGRDQPVRLGEGRSLALSPDGQFVAGINPADPGTLLIIPAGPGATRRIHGGGFEFQAARFFPDGKTLLASVSQPAGRRILLVQPLDGGAARPLAENMSLSNGVVSQNSQQVAASDGRGDLVILSIGGQVIARPLPGTPLIPLQWDMEGKSIYVRRPNPLAPTVYKLDLAGGSLTEFVTSTPKDITGVIRFAKALLTPDGKSYVSSYVRQLSELYFVSGWK